MLVTLVCAPVRYAAPEMTTGYSSAVTYELFSRDRQPLLSRVTPEADPTGDYQRETQRALPLKSGDNQMDNALLFTLVYDVGRGIPGNSEYFNDIKAFVVVVDLSRICESIASPEVPRDTFGEGRCASDSISEK
ncbi:hypothetical protein Pmar_PMAR002627 [Perkinsus marinus ATCC 50983]|uniref:Uncharacterized protein n=1 Tax=Perkinsus marinus (strain ATCC 50983 / TXsc) TaxID=423536 RepID=C5LNV1_PERM5|nr:hypothetical protein Pmar_PMAR002627 [Perkinsus marinus ATCC 50983]EER01592.1 hypothetical protein Pmar_PMAR002627 [Perkinsus marinus ATCC 50983]|eukprot:XP_002768874.1 hypothetical protein Pmar_PMAR002627 [Perkinsus marinus ATCC 50983]